MNRLLISYVLMDGLFIEDWIINMLWIIYRTWKERWILYRSWINELNMYNLKESYKVVINQLNC